MGVWCCTIEANIFVLFHIIIHDHPSHLCCPCMVSTGYKASSAPSAPPKRSPPNTPGPPYQNIKPIIKYSGGAQSQGGMRNASMMRGTNAAGLMGGGLIIRPAAPPHNKLPVLSYSGGVKSWQPNKKTGGSASVRYSSAYACHRVLRVHRYQHSYGH